MSDEWIEEAAQQVVDDVHSDMHICRSPSKSIADTIETIRRFHAAYIASCDPEKIAERIADECYCVFEMHWSGHIEQGDIRPRLENVTAKILAPLLSRNSAIEAVLMECRGCVEASRVSALYDAMNSDDKEFESECRAEAALWEGVLSRIDKLTAKGAGQ